MLDEDRRRCESAGMDAFVSKPTKPNALAEMLERFVPATADTMAEPAADATPRARCA